MLYYVLLADQIFLSDYIYILRIWVVYLLYLFVFQSKISPSLSYQVVLLCHENGQGKNLNILRTKKKYKIFFISFKGLSVSAFFGFQFMSESAFNLFQIRLKVCIYYKRSFLLFPMSSKLFVTTFFKNFNSLFHSYIFLSDLLIIENFFH